MKEKKLTCFALITLSFIALCTLSACTSTRPLGQVYNKPVSEKIIKIPSGQSVEIIQKPTAQNPELKFIVVTPTGEYILKRYEKIEKFEKTTSYKPLKTIGFILAGLGIAYFLDNPVPDSSQYSEDKYNDLADDALANRKSGITIAALGSVAAGIGIFAADKKSVSEKSSGMVEEKLAISQQKIQFTISVSGTDVAGMIGEKGEGAIKMDELLKQYFSDKPEFPEKTAIEIRLDGESVTKTGVAYRIEEVVSIMSQGKVDWRIGTPPKGFIPYLEAKAELTSTVKAGVIILKISLSNKEGKSDCHRLQVITKSDEPLFNNKRILIGHVKAGAESLIEEKFTIPEGYKFTKEGKFLIAISFKELNGFVPKPVEVEAIIK